MSCLLRSLGKRASERVAKFLAERLPAVAILAVLPWLDRPASESSVRRLSPLPLGAETSIQQGRSQQELPEN